MTWVTIDTGWARDRSTRFAWKGNGAVLNETATRIIARTFRAGFAFCSTISYNVREESLDDSRSSSLSSAYLVGREIRMRQDHLKSSARVSANGKASDY